MDGGTKSDFAKYFEYEICENSECDDVEGEDFEHEVWFEYAAEQYEL